MPRQRRKTRRTAGSGSVFYDKSRRRWVGRVVQADGSRRSVTARSQEEAIKRLNRVLGLGALGAPQESSLTVEQWLRHWIDNVAPARAHSTQTLANDRWAVERHLIPGLGRRKLTKLSVEDVELMLKTRAEDGLGRSSLQRLRTVLAKALDEAIRRERITRHNVARYAVLPPTARPPKVTRSMTADEARQLFEVADENDMGAMVRVGLMLGLRPGELTGLVWDDVDLDAGTLRVDQALVRGPGSSLKRADPKTPKSRRNIALPDPLVVALREHRDRQKVRTLTAAEDFVFATSKGTPLDPSNVRRSFAKLCNDAGLGHWTLVDLRRTAASLLSEAAVPIDHVTDLLGHVDSRMLDRHYRRSTKGAFGAAVSPMETLFSADPPPSETRTQSSHRRDP